MLNSLAIKEFFGNKALQEWDDKAVVRREAALETYREKLKDVITYHKKSLNISSTNNGLI